MGGGLLVAVALFGGDSVAAADNAYCELAVNYDTGSFGGSVRSELQSTGLSCGLLGRKFDGGISISYLSLSVAGAGSESGAGDVLLRGGYRLSEQASAGLATTVSLSVKLPVADERKGLGTGQTDVGLYAGFSRQFSGAQGNVHLGYVRVGDAPTVDYEDSRQFGFALFKGVGRAGVSVSLEGRTATVRDAEDPLELHVLAFFLLNRDYALGGGMFAGLNDGAADYGGSVGVTLWF